MGNSSDEMVDKQQIQKWARQIKGHKATLQNVKERLDKAKDVCKKESYSNLSQKRLNQLFNKYIESHEAILEIYNNILATDCMSKADMKSWQERYNELTEVFNTIEE